MAADGVHGLARLLDAWGVGAPELLAYLADAAGDGGGGGGGVLEQRARSFALHGTGARAVAPV